MVKGWTICFDRRWHSGWWCNTFADDFGIDNDASLELLCKYTGNGKGWFILLSFVYKFRVFQLTSLQIICSSGDEDVKSCLLVPNNKNSEIFFRSFIVFLKLFAFRKFLWLLERYGWLSQVVRPPNIEQNGPADDAEGVAVRANLGNILTWCCWTAIYWKVLYIMVIQS